jgi:hypothetical protein
MVLAGNRPFMSRYIARSCPKCQDEFWITVSHPRPESRELPIIGFCFGCGYRLINWRLIVRRKQAPDVRYGRMPKVFKT